MSPLLPTDSRRDTPEDGVRVDTVAVQGPTTENLLYELRNRQLDRTIDYETGEVVEVESGINDRIPVGLTTVRVDGGRRNGAAWMRAEFSIPKAIYGTNALAFDRALTLDAVDAVLTRLTDDLPDVPQIDNVELRRGDFTQDVEVLTPLPQLLSTFSQLRVQRATMHKLYCNDGRPNVLMIGSPSRWIVRAYDKANELRTAARKSPQLAHVLNAWADERDRMLRVEVELRAPVFRELGVTAMTDLTPDLMQKIRDTYLSRVGLDVPYGGADVVSEKLRVLQDRLSPADMRALLAFLGAERHGLDMPMSHTVIERVRPIVRREQLLVEAVGTQPRRLDLALGREVAV